MVVIERCPRCGRRHADLATMPLARPAGEFTEHGKCPSTGEPIFMRQTKHERIGFGKNDLYCEQYQLTRLNKRQPEIFADEWEAI